MKFAKFPVEASLVIVLEFNSILNLVNSLPDLSKAYVMP